mmetsp:Transcript_47784/g.111463  ORF Transcript_47784/g.111463 Transcript_47784/m.111463 type:complete len:269 (+) Transcript_47784:177-983(+)
MKQELQPGEDKHHRLQRCLFRRTQVPPHRQLQFPQSQQCLMQHRLCCRRYHQPALCLCFPRQDPKCWRSPHHQSCRCQPTLVHPPHRASFPPLHCHHKQCQGEFRQPHLHLLCRPAGRKRQNAMPHLRPQSTRVELCGSQVGCSTNVVLPHHQSFLCQQILVPPHRLVSSRRPPCSHKWWVCRLRQHLQPSQQFLPQKCQWLQQQLHQFVLLALPRCQCWLHRLLPQLLLLNSPCQQTSGPRLHLVSSRPRRCQHRQFLVQCPRHHCL